MAKIIAFGCSFTFGEGLDDSFSDVEFPELLKFSNHAYPNILSNALGMQCINLAYPGSSNKKILRNILEYKFDKADIAIVMWTTPARSTIYYPDPANDLMLHRNRAFQKHESQFFRVHTPYDIEYSDAVHIMSGVNYLKSLGIEFYNCNIGIDISVNVPWFATYQPQIKFSDFIVDETPDGSKHPGIHSHRKLANHMLRFIK